MRLVHEESGASFEAPDAWQQVVGDDGTVIALEPDHDGAFRASLVLTVVSNGDVGFRDWQVGTDALLPETLADYLLIDLEKCAVGGRPGGRRLAHHVSAAGAALVMEQWFTTREQLGITLTATIDALRFAGAASLLAAAGASLDLGGSA